MVDGGEEGNAAAHRGFLRHRDAVRASLDADELMVLMHGSDSIWVELTRLENELKEVVKTDVLDLGAVNFSVLGKDDGVSFHLVSKNCRPPADLLPLLN
ncbi:hypothetical protein ZWY2020_033603 [Hordeum vulgare]|nr:hypothetical protein ZWY2020_033603 [Hordeum vulgare]